MNKEGQLNFLGIGSAYNPVWKNTSAYFVKENQFFLIDSGETVFSTLFEKGYLVNYSKLRVFVTHTHADHVGSLPSLLSYCYNVLGKKVEVYYPRKEIQILLDNMGLERECYSLHMGMNWDFEDISIRAVSVNHAEDIYCYGYLISGLEGTVYYSGDCYQIPNNILEDFQKGKINRIYQDTTEFPSSHRSHCPLEELERLFPEKDRSRIYCMHFTTDFFEKLERLGFSYVKSE